MEPESSSPYSQVPAFYVHTAQPFESANYHTLPVCFAILKLKIGN